MDVSTSEPVYASGDDPAPDGDFEVGDLRHLVTGRRGRLRDPRRTPVRVGGVDLARGFFEVEILAFEDAGARWLVPFESVDRYQFVPGPDAPDGVVAAMREVVTALDRPLSVPADPAARAGALRRLGEERIRAGRWLDDAGVAAVDLDPLVRTRSGDPALCALLVSYLGERDLQDLEAEFAETYVSNPRSGEVVKGHAIVLAELGLCPFSGTVVRDASLFTGPGAKDRRGQYLLSRMGFVQALFHRATPTHAPLFRGLGVDGPLPPPRAASFESATFSLDVALAHFQADRATAALYRQRLPVDRLFMTFVETSAMNRQYREAEAVLIGDPDNRAF
jgi:hypothetical protein